MILQWVDVLLILQGLNSCLEVNFGLEELVGRYFILLPEVLLMVWVYLHLMVDHLWQLLMIKGFYQRRPWHASTRHLAACLGHVVVVDSVHLIVHSSINIHI